MAYRNCSPRVVLKVLVIIVVLLQVYLIACVGLGLHVVHRHSYPATVVQTRTVNKSHKCSQVKRTHNKYYNLTMYENTLKHIVNVAGLPEKELEVFLNVYRDYCNQKFPFVENSTQCPCIPANLGKFKRFPPISPHDGAAGTRWKLLAIMIRHGA